MHVIVFLEAVERGSSDFDLIYGPERRGEQKLHRVSYYGSVPFGQTKTLTVISTYQGNHPRINLLSKSLLPFRRQGLELLGTSVGQVFGGIISGLRG